MLTLTEAQLAAIQARIAASARLVQPLGRHEHVQDDLTKAKARNAKRLAQSPGARGARGGAPSPPKGQQRSQKAKTKLPEPSEHDSQVAVCLWWALWSKSKGLDERLLFAIPMGGDRHPAVAAKLRAEGCKLGVPDLMLALPVWSGEVCLFPGLFIEMKRRGSGRVRPEQSGYAELLRLQGYSVVCCWSADEAIRAITAFAERAV